MMRDSLITLYRKGLEGRAGGSKLQEGGHSHCQLDAQARRLGGEHDSCGRCLSRLSLPPFQVQLVASFESLGYAHILLLSYNKEECDGLLQLLPSLGGCVWTSFKLNEDSGIHERYFLWFLRYRTLVRAVRLGYNVLMTDNDVTFFYDP